MKLYFSEPMGRDRLLLFERGVENYLITSFNRNMDTCMNAFFNHHGWDNIEFFKDKNLMVDSGAFSVWNTGGEVLLENYMSLIDSMLTKHEKTFKNLYFVALDKIPGTVGNYPTKAQREESAEVSFSNYLEMIKVFPKEKIIPVVHQHEDESWLKKYEEITDYVCISPANDETNAGRQKWLDKIYTIINPQTKTHGLAVTGFHINLRYPFYSVDSMSWRTSGLYGRTFWWKFFSPIMNTRVSKIKNLKEVREKDLRDLVITIDELDSELSNRDKGWYAMRHNVEYYLKLEEYMTALWEHRGVTWKE